MSKLDDMGLDAFCDAIIDGETYRSIARKLKISPSFVVKWLAADGERLARARAAREMSAQSADEEALEVLKDPKVDPARAREIAQHLRWRAKVTNPREYGEKLQVDNTHKVVDMTDAQIEERSRQIRARLAAAADALDAEDQRKLIEDAGSGSV